MTELHLDCRRFTSEFEGLYFSAINHDPFWDVTDGNFCNFETLASDRVKM